jgi:hypothetical protein
MLMMDNDANDDAATQMMGKDADNDDTATGINTATKTTRWRNNQQEKWHGRPWRDKVAVVVAVDVDRARTRAGAVLAVAMAVAVARVVVVAVAVVRVVAVAVT